MSEFIPDIEPSRVLFVDLGATDFNFGGLNETVTETSDPCYLETGAGREVDCVEFDFETGFCAKITIAENSDIGFSAKIRVALHGLFNCFHGKVSVSSVDALNTYNFS